MALDLIFLVMIFFAVGLALLPFPLTFALRRYLKNEPPPNLDKSMGKVAVILPCKGLDPGFEDNIQAVLNQSYYDIVYYFVTATSDDPAYSVLQQLIADAPRQNAHLLVAGIASVRAQKLTNQLAAIDAIGTDANILVFLDSDIRPDHEFIAHLINPLDQPGVGAATGFRWYIPCQTKFGAYLQATWNAGGLPFLANDRLNYAWGGAMAIYRHRFQECSVAKSWGQALSDDFTLTYAVKKHGYQIRFVPRCVAFSHANATLRETIEWTNRQTRIARVYSPGFWLSVALVHGLLNFFIGLGIFLLLIGGMLSNLVVMFFGIGLLLPLIFEYINAILLFDIAMPLLGVHRHRIQKHRFIYIIFAPFASVLAFFNTLNSVFNRKITWRGIVYEMISPTETRVHEYH